MMFNYGGSASPFDPARSAIGQHNYSPLSKLLQQQPQALQQQPFDHSAGIGEFERRQFQPDLTPRPFDPSAGIGDFEARQFQPYNQQEPQALQQMGMRQQSLPQMPAMQPLLQQFRTQQRPYQSPYQNLDKGYRSGSAYAPLRQLNMLAPLNSNALNFSY